MSAATKATEDDLRDIGLRRQRAIAEKDLAEADIPDAYRRALGEGITATEQAELLGIGRNTLFNILRRAG